MEKEGGNIPHENLQEYRGKNQSCAYCGNQFVIADIVSLAFGDVNIEGKIFCFRIEDYKENLRGAFKAGTCRALYVQEHEEIKKDFGRRPIKFIGDVDPDYNL